MAGDDMGALVNFGRGLAHGHAIEANGVSVTFQSLDAGWLEMTIVVGQNTVAWDLSDVLDPFAAAPRPEDAGHFRTTFVHWLQDIADGNFTDVAVDMEGWTGAILIAPSNSESKVLLSVLTSNHGLNFVVSIDRRILVRDFYNALITYWESDELKTNWAQWSDKPKWSLRSAVVENYLAS